MQKKCSECHARGAQVSNDWQGLDRLSMLNAGVLVPGDPENSSMYTEVQSEEMPKNRKVLSNSEKKLIYDFILNFNELNKLETELKFADIKSQIIAPKCLNCHSENSATSDLKLQTYAQVILTIQIGDHKNSLLWNAVTTDHYNSQISAQQRQKLAEWINSGAPQ